MTQVNREEYLLEEPYVFESFWPILPTFPIGQTIPEKEGKSVSGPGVLRRTGPRDGPPDPRVGFFFL